MMTMRTFAAAILVVAFAFPASRVLGAEPTLADIAACNEAAAARTGGSALPRAAAPAPPAGGSAPSVERELPRQGGSEKSDPTGSIVIDSPDPLAKGMDAQRASDPAYRTAYRDCMKKRAERSR